MSNSEQGLSSERWRQIEALYHAALEREGPERDRLLDERCAGDQALRHEVESLLLHGAATTAFFDAPAVELVTEPSERAASFIGTRLGAYEITGLLGAGGMGRVYRAHDSRLGRDVAIKVLDERFSTRFEREVRAVAALNHPNVCTLHDIGPNYLVMEFVEGRSLAVRMMESPLPPGLILHYGIQIAEALAAAHEKGIVHRDLKPENVLVTTREHLKLVDFGLALIRVSSDATGSDPALFSSVVTRPGTILGTLPYMSPEQVRGESTDARTDLFSLGVLLYEAATGRRAFARSTQAETIAAILKEEPPPIGHDPELDAVIRRCLVKDAANRVGSASEVGDALRAIAAARGSDYAGAVRRDSGAGSDPSHPRARVDTTTRTASVSSAVGAEQIRTPRRRALVWRLAALGVVLAAIAIVLVLTRGDAFVRNPIADAQFQRLTDFNGTEQAAAISRDGSFVAFLSDRDGQMDVWVTQVGTGQFYNLTRGRAKDLVNPAIRTLGFSPDGALVTFWARGLGSTPGGISVWAVPTLGGEPRPYLEGAAEFEWTADGSNLLYHTPADGDPMFVRTRGQSGDRSIFTAAAGLHAHFPVWSPDQDFIYFVHGAPDGMDIWRMRPDGGMAEQITRHNSRVSYPVAVNRRTMLYLATDRTGSGPWLHSLDLSRREAHRVSSGVDRYTSLAASADGRRVVLSVASPKGTFWRIPVSDAAVALSGATAISLTTAGGFSPRLGPGYLLYVASKGTGHSIWKLPTGGTATELWSEPDTRIIGGPEIEPRGQRIAFSIEQGGKTKLYVMNADGTGARAVTESLELRGSPAWTPDAASITSAANVDGAPRLFTIALDGVTMPLVSDYSIDPAWAPDGEMVVYSGPDIGTTFPVKAANKSGPVPLRDLTLTRGGRRLRFLPGRRALVVMRGEVQHKNLWLIELDTGAERQLTSVPADFDIRDFDISPDGSEIVLERVEEDSDVVLLEMRGKQGS